MLDSNMKENIRNFTPMVWTLMGFVLSIAAIFAPVSDRSKDIAAQTASLLYAAAFGMANPGKVEKD
jgi:hypothetical protein